MYCKVAFDVPLDNYFDYAVPTDLSSKVIPGVRITAPFGRMLMTGLVVSVSEETALENHVLIKEIATVLDDKPLFGSDLFSLAQFIKEKWGGSIGQILFALVPPQAYFKLLPPGTIQPFEIQLPEASAEINSLSTYLEQGFKHILLETQDSKAVLAQLLPLIKTVLKNYGQILLTLPEVLAAHQVSLELKELFPDELILEWHSKMLLSRKKQIFSRISHGFPGILVSTRSGALLPFKNLRLAIMLEEENDAYKQEENRPHFHARDLLQYRCKQHEALFLSVSDTPSLEILYAVQQGQCQLLQLPISGQTLPHIQISEKKGSYSNFLSDALYTQISAQLAQKKASLLLFNRRGYANTYYCLNCGAYAKCKKCGTILVYEKDATGLEQLVCKKCGQKETLEQTCPKCQNKIFKSRGSGTQKIVTEISRLWPAARVLRLDSDTLKNKEGQGYQVLRALNQGEADIVVGTNLAVDMAAAQTVHLAAILDADLELDSPDFRASEKFGQVLFKLRNRLALRSDCHLLIQASSADIYPFELLRQNYDVCAKEELQARESFAYPPYIRLVKVLIKSKDPVLLEAETARVMSVAAACATEVLGPVKTGKQTDTVKKQYLLLKTTSQQYPELIKLLNGFKPSKKTEIRLIADPYDFY